MSADPLGRLVEGLSDPGAAVDNTRWRSVPRQPREAAVLALFGLADRGPQIVLTERAADLRSHPGQVSLPGGAVEPADPDLPATALREAAEEVALRTDTVQILGELPPVPVPVSHFNVTAVIGRWQHPHALRAADPAEVAAVHQVPIEVLAAPQTRCTAVHPRGFTSPGFVFGTDSGREVFVWGLTAFLLDALLRLGGWERPWQVERRLPVPKERL
ncbi:NUDIX hydrolase [Naumannella halotolerans]|uniref:NUDIX hydrolase n=1 Tax=Naumannella halotolerans TaxID=993414 RepID=UPI00370D4397